MGNMKKFVIRIVLAVCAFVATSPLFALPGFMPYIPDISGEYVYYRDYSFPRESYIGFLAYDNATYAARYYAPRDVAAGLVEENVLIYVSLDPTLDYIKMTGERIGTSITPEQADYVNYLHDLIYEFGARRIKAGDITPENTELFTRGNYGDSGKSIAQDYAQFGGRVHILFDYLVPLFNIKKIISNDNSILFEIVTMGRLETSEDNSFTAFSGLPKSLPRSTSSWKANGSTEKKDFHTDDGQKITLDNFWSQSMENLWLLNDVGLVSVTTAHASSEDKNFSIMQFLRRLMQSTENSYIMFKDISILQKGKRYTLNASFYQSASGNAIRSFRVVTERENDSALFMLTVFNSTYETNRSYFDEILKSYSVK